jgi:hypothetical protein
LQAGPTHHDRRGGEGGRVACAAWRSGSTSPARAPGLHGRPVKGQGCVADGVHGSNASSDPVSSPLATIPDRGTVVP